MPSCTGKLRYANAVAARKGAKRATRQMGGAKHYAYECGDCRGYHTSTMDPQFYRRVIRPQQDTSTRTAKATVREVHQQERRDALQAKRRRARR